MLALLISTVLTWVSLVLRTDKAPRINQTFEAGNTEGDGMQAALLHQCNAQRSLKLWSMCLIGGTDVVVHVV